MHNEYGTPANATGTSNELHAQFVDKKLALENLYAMWSRSDAGVPQAWEALADALQHSADQIAASALVRPDLTVDEIRLLASLVQYYGKPDGDIADRLALILATKVVTLFPEVATCCGSR